MRVGRLDRSDTRGVARSRSQGRQDALSEQPLRKPRWRRTAALQLRLVPPLQRPRPLERYLPLQLRPVQVQLRQCLVRQLKLRLWLVVRLPAAYSLAAKADAAAAGPCTHNTRNADQHIEGWPHSMLPTRLRARLPKGRSRAPPTCTYETSL